jgi:hypothetical protein
MLPTSMRLHPRQPPGLPRAQKQWTVAEALVGGSTLKKPTPRPQEFVALATAIAMGVFGSDPHSRPPLQVAPSIRGSQARGDRKKGPKEKSSKASVQKKATQGKRKEHDQQGATSKRPQRGKGKKRALSAGAGEEAGGQGAGDEDDADFEPELSSDDEYVDVSFVRLLPGKQICSARRFD